MSLNVNPDVIVVGSGLAGLYTALNIEKNINILLISKEEIKENNSSLAQGGIAAPIKKEDSYELHIEDTLKAGSKYNNLDMLNILIKYAPQNIKELIKIGVEFDRDKNGEIRTTMEGGHSKRRVLHAGGDATGREIIKRLEKEARIRGNIDIWENTVAIDLIKKDNSCMGVKVLKDDKIVRVISKHVVIATGGIGEVYNNTTNSKVATGDGVAMAYRIGCNIKDMEFIQFHPTAFYDRDEGKKFLISEAVRGEGAILRNIYGDRFMEKYHIDKELAPRDIVAQSIYKELKNTKKGYVLLDITHRDRSFLQNRFPTIYKRCLEKGIRMEKDLIPVTPVEHYFIGGIKVDKNGKTNIENLYACGECSNTGVHGANRLASNSLLECVVFGGRIADDINNNTDKVDNINYIDIETVSTDNKIDFDIESIRKTIRETMGEYVGIVRNIEGLYKAKSIIEDILKRLNNNFYYSRDYIETLSMATVASLIINSCIKRRNSLGCHYIES
ncbi:L-aspartate oxidase [Dethiothermospora halolimnae]|uniref:L-aspartate oxidase n=1 Tax=Dethiothermospora halolimnae TaxID=3114390 RepID=UPI003CCBE1D2